MNILLILGAYLIGSVSFAVVVSKCMRLPDPHSYGSGNPGATNVLRTGNKLAAVLTLLGDALKGWFAVLLGRAILGDASLDMTLNSWVLCGIVLAVFLGHLFPIFHGFKGGKGVATALGILLAISPWLGLLIIITWLLVFAATKYSSLAAIVASILLPVYAASLNWFEAYRDYEIVFVFLALMLVWRHRSNIKKLLDGTESGFGKKKH